MLSRLLLVHASLLLLFVLQQEAHAAMVLKQGHVLHRHGDRTSLGSTLPCASVVWPNGDGQLTAVGCQQMQRIGRALRDRYCPGLVSCTYKPSDIYAMTSRYDRTMASANCALTGFYELVATSDVTYNDSGVVTPNGTASPQNMVPVWPYDDSSNKYDSNFYLRGYDTCRPYYYPWPASQAAETALYSRAITNNPDFIAASQAYLPNITKWANVTCLVDTPYHLLHDFVDMLFDPLHVQAEHGKLGAVASYFDTPTLDATYRTASFMEGWHFKGKEIGRVVAGPFLNLMSTRMQNKIAGRSTKPLYWHSAHDSTIQSICAGLGIQWTSQNLPPYASWLAFDLYQDSTTLQWYTLATFHAGDRNLFDNVDSSFTQVMTDYCTDAAPGCAADSNGFCPFNCTLALFNAQGLSVPDWNSQYSCGIALSSSSSPSPSPSSSSSDTDKTLLGLTIFFAVMFGIALVACVVLLMKVRSAKPSTYATELETSQSKI